MSQACINCGKEDTSLDSIFAHVLKQEHNPGIKDEMVADAQANTNISISKMISLVFNINVFTNAFYNDVSCFMCSNCIKTFHTLYLSKIKFLRNAAENSLLSKIITGRNDAAVPTQSIKNEFANLDCPTFCPEAILPDQEEIVDDQKFNTLEKSYKSCVVLNELFLRLKIPKLSTENVNSVRKSKSIYRNTFVQGKTVPSPLKRKSKDTKASKKSKCVVDLLQNETSTCIKCFRLFPNEEFMMNHFDAAHKTNEQKISCTLCSSKFSSSWFFKHHMKTCHQGIEILFACKICTISFYCETDLQEHNEKTHRKYPFGCNNCMESFTTIAELRTHLITSHKKTKDGRVAVSNLKEMERLNNLKKCTLCKKSCNSVSQLQQHKKSEHDVSEFTCYICGGDKIFDSETTFKKHLKDHTKCDICGKPFIDLYKLKRHIQEIHSTLYEFGCEMCGLRRSSLNSLLNHYTYHKTKAGPKLFCNICNKSFVNQAHLTSHMKYCHTSKPIQIPCEKCGEKFFTRGLLNEHLKSVHKLVAQFSCSKCDRKFLHKFSLRAHSRIHGQVYVYHQGPEFRQEKVVIKNDKVETTSCFSEETALYTCPVCGKTMEWKSHFRRHLRYHDLSVYTDPEKDKQVKRTVKCPYAECTRIYPRKDILYRHIHRTHEETSKQCVKNIGSNCKLCGLRIEGDSIKVRRFHEQLHSVQIILGKGISCSDSNGENKINGSEKMDLTRFYNYECREYKCTFCSTKVFFTQQQEEFINHLKQSHKLKISNEDLNCGLLSFECKKCKNRFTTPYQLNRHLRETCCGKTKINKMAK